MATTITNIHSTTSGMCSMYITADTTSLSINATTIVSPGSFITGASLTQLKASRLYRALTRLYATSAEAIAAARKLLISIAPDSVAIVSMEMGYAAVAAGSYYQPAIVVTPTPGVAPYNVKLVAPNSIAR